MHNYFTYLYNQTVYETLQRKKGAGEACLFARSATVGGQQFPVHWGGDCLANYPSMAETLRGGLSLAFAGFGFWSHDISGFEHTATPDLYKRWAAFGLFSSHSRLHGNHSYRVPWLFDEESCDVLRFFTKQKMRLMPYLYAQAVYASQTAIPMLRPMVMEFPSDYTCHTLDMQYMLGDSLLVAPIFQENGEVHYYLPQGTWTHYLTGKAHDGGQWYEEQYDYFGLPLFVREKTLLALGARDDRPDYDYFDGLTLQPFGLQEGPEASCTVYDQKGENPVTAAARMENGKISVTLSRPLARWRVVFQNASVDATGSRSEFNYPEA